MILNISIRLAITWANFDIKTLQQQIIVENIYYTITVGKCFKFRTTEYVNFIG